MWVSIRHSQHGCFYSRKQNQGYNSRTLSIRAVTPEPLYGRPFFFFFFAGEYRAGGCGQKQQAEKQEVTSLLCGIR